MVNKASSIQIIGTQRSGSNLLRLILNQFDEVSAPHPPHVLRTFVPLLDYYGSLNHDDNFLSLSSDIADFVNANPVPWNKQKIKAETLFSRSKDRSLLALYETLYTIKAEHDKAKIWCCKSMFNEYYAKEIEAGGINPFYIYIYRDGRDVAASFKNAIIGPKHIYHIANKWLADQQKAEQVYHYVGEDRFFKVKYEDLITDTERVLRSLSAKLGLSYSSKLLNYYRSQESKQTALSGEMWKNVSRPIIKNNIGKYKIALSKDEVRLFEQITAKMLIALGYVLSTTQNIELIDLSPPQIDEFNKKNKLMQEQARASASEHDLTLRNNQEKVVQHIKQRIGAI